MARRGAHSDQTAVMEAVEKKAEAKSGVEEENGKGEDEEDEDDVDLVCRQSVRSAEDDVWREKKV